MCVRRAVTKHSTSGTSAKGKWYCVRHTSCVLVYGHVFIPLSNHLITKTDVLTAVYINRSLLLVRFSYLQKSYNLHSHLHLIFNTLCSARLICEAVQESQVTSPYVVCTVFIALGTVLNVGALSFSEKLVLLLPDSNSSHPWWHSSAFRNLVHWKNATSDELCKLSMNESVKHICEWSRFFSSVLDG
jgi:hypothetical protein